MLREIHDLLIKNGKTLAIAESCTGGQLSALLTSLPGSSAYFILGAIVYSNRSKSLLLHIPEKMIRDHGAVSSVVCRRMAHSARTLAEADFGIGITGIAGPSGAVPGKKTGTVFISVSEKKRNVCRRFYFKGPRSTVRSLSCAAALRMLSGALKKNL
jgi:nicotinamide-nucleotide amidase